MPTISVVIPCLNEEKYVGKLLEDLVCQTRKPDEVIVADCRSDDKTIDTVRYYSNKLPLKIAISEIRSPGAARNAGAKAATSEYLLFIDADMRVPAHLIQEIKKSLIIRPTDYLTPSYRSDGTSFMDSLSVSVVNLRMTSLMRLLKNLWGMGGVMCVKKEVHIKIGGFDTHMQTRNDVDYLNKLRTYRASFTYLRHIKAVTTGRRFEGDGIAALIKLAVRSKKPRNYGHYK